MHVQLLIGIYLLSLLLTGTKSTKNENDKISSPKRKEHSADADGESSRVLWPIHSGSGRLEEMFSSGLSRHALQADISHTRDKSPVRGREEVSQTSDGLAVAYPNNPTGTVFPNESEHGASGLNSQLGQTVAMNRKRTIERFLKRKREKQSQTGVGQTGQQHIWHGNEFTEIFLTRPSSAPSDQIDDHLKTSKGESPDS
jgi:hypothetical protein